MPTETVELTEQQKISVGLRELADFLDEQPQFLGCPFFSMLKPTTTRKEFLKLARQLGPFDKEVCDDRYTLTRKFGAIELKVYCDRKVICTKRLVTRTVEEWDCPDHLLENGEKEVGDE